MGSGGRPNSAQGRFVDDKTYSEEVRKIVVEGNVDVLVGAAKRIGKDIRRVKTSQLRGLFASTRKIQLSWETDQKRAYRSAVLLRPRITYAASRNDLFTLDTVLLDSLQHVSGDLELARRRFMNFVDFFEAIVAYHAAQGDRN